ncbi:hypothetical protein JDV02_000579 [Purpureocillium takamizusanense]|uniref:Uncharacterized protein n=1 Tax=Purpureocillium takamizusanense TaxID=2060973 RepID=A0A9Q8Q570_9HYPO|nr:uncharacterized protein JDV02_000579 [Purpureocillium takamizusanense]UNI13883.1 hypothetical protein JDV02_000579 [Purpureocillium takamizusanense]
MTAVSADHLSCKLSAAQMTRLRLAVVQNGGRPTQTRAMTTRRQQLHDAILGSQLFPSFCLKQAQTAPSRGWCCGNVLYKSLPLCVLDTGSVSTNSSEATLHFQLRARPLGIGEKRQL